ncbi:MAG: hypothetical protein RIT25_2240, partial [Planctomycetota bacterium]
MQQLWQAAILPPDGNDVDPQDVRC